MLDLSEIIGRTATGAARAKLNLTLDVTGRLPDGYHEIRSVMCAADLSDDVTVRIGRNEGGNVAAARILGEGFTRIIPADSRNTAVKAANAFFSAADIIECRADIIIYKRIPVGAGLGGGSADAAAVLRLLNILFGRPFGMETLREIGASVGADVPFCIEGGTMLAHGRGDLLSGLPPLPDCEIVIVKPRFSVSTAELFHRIDSISLTARPDTEGFIEELQAQNLSGTARRVFNVFEEVMPVRRYEEIANIKSRLLDSGALSASMTGTGSAVFGIFEHGAAGTAHGALKLDYRDCFLCGTAHERDEICLVSPAPEHETAAAEFAAEYYANGEARISGSGGLHNAKVYSEWLNKLRTSENRETVPEGLVPSTTLFALRAADNKIVGIIDIRHELNGALRVTGGHIGYSVRPGERGRGCATRMLALALARCRELGLSRVLITCAKSNAASARVMLKNGAVLEDEITPHGGETVRRYWIAL